MAELRVFDNIFENKCKNRFYSETFDIKEEVSKFADDSVYQDTLVECYDEETGETFFAPLSDDTNTDSVLVLANGKSVDFNYVPKSTDIVSVVFLPLSNTKGGWQWGGFGMGALSGALIGFAFGLATLNPAVMLIGSAVGAVVGGVVGAVLGGVFYDKMKIDTNSSYDTGKDGEKLPDVRGAENQALTGNSFPFVIGKHLVTPFVIGNPYTTYEGENGQDAVIREVLVAGYAPMRLTDFKLGDVWLAYNRTINGTERASVLNGKLTPDTKLTSAAVSFVKNENTIGDFIRSVCPLLNTDIHKEKVLSLSGTITVLTATENFTSITIKESSTKGFNTVVINSVEFNGNLNDPLPYNITVTTVKTQNDSNADGDILSYWKNNDVEIEILQQHPDKPVNYGDIYPAKAVDTDVNANLLYVIDGDIEEVAKKKNIVYKNQGFINGLRTNRVQFTEKCPMEFTVNLDMPSGLYSQWSWDGKTTYGKIPLWIALQWRFYSENNSSSKEDGSDCANWHDFLPSGSDEYADYTSNFKGERRIYDETSFRNDIIAHEGNTFSDETVKSIENVWAKNEGTLFEYLDNVPQTSIGLKTSKQDKKTHISISWTDSSGYNQKIEKDYYDYSREIRDSHGMKKETFVYKATEEIFETSFGAFRCIKLVSGVKNDYNNNKYYLFADNDFLLTDSSTGVEYKCVLDGHTHLYGEPSDEKKFVTNFNIIFSTVRQVSYITGSWFKKSLLNFEEYSGEDGTSEMRASFTCKLNIEGCKKIINDGTNKIKGIEIRAIRVSPNYLNMTHSWGSDDKGSPKQYSDSIMWQSLVTKTFNEDKLTSLLERQAAGYVDATDEYILSQIPEKNLSEADLRKLCVIAIKAKADVNGTLQQQLKKINCVAESFSPVYDEDGKHWFPMDVHKETGYYKPVQNTAGTPDGWEEVTKEQYEEARGKGLSWKKENKGSNFTDNMLRFALNTKDNNGRNVLSALHSTFNENNAVSGFLLAAVGGQNGAAAVGYEDLNMLSLVDGYTFCESVMDGSTYSKDTTDNTGFHSKGSPVVIKFSANAYLYQQQKLEDLLKKLAICSRAVVTYDSCGRLQLVVDKKDDYPKGVINQQNCVSGTNIYSWSELPAGLQFSFSDENDGYEQNQVYCWSDNNSLKSYKGQVQSYGIDYVTNPAQLWSLGRYVLACMLLQRETLTRKIGAEGEVFSLGDTVLVQDSSLLLGDGSARIQEVIEDNQYIYGFITDSVFEYRGEIADGKCKQGVTVLQPAQFGKSRTVTVRLAVPGSQVIGGNFTYTMTKGSTNICLLDEKIQKVGGGDPGDSGAVLKCHFKTNDIVMFGDYTLISQKYRITKIKPEQDGTYTETLLPYFDELYEYGAPLPSFQSPVKMPPAEKDPFSLSEVPDNIADQNKNISNIVENVAATITSTIDINKYTLDISPEAQSIPADSNGKLVSSWFYISAYLYYMDRQITESITYKAYLSSGDEVGQWDGNRVRISSSFLKGDVLYITIKVIYKIDELNVVEREVQAQISRLYGADTTKIYKMLFLDGEKVKVDNTGEVADPEQLRVTKRVASGKSENNTDFGHITLETVPDGKEAGYSGYEQVGESESFSEKKTYYHATVPFLVKAGENAVIGDGEKSGALFFMEKLK